MSGHFAHNLQEKTRTDDVLIDQDIVFPSLLLPDFILRGLGKAGFKKPSPIQLAAIPLARCGLDLIVQAKSGTGKTLVFTVTTLEVIKVKLKRLQAIILAPTREIAIQITDVIKAVACYIKGLKVKTFIGGMPMEVDKLALSGCHIAVGAPGRVRHLIQQGFMDSSAVRLLILDEADKLMEEIFLKDINYIFNKCCSSKQTIACSATYTPELLGFVNQYMKSGRHVVPEGSTVPVLLGLRQFVCITEDHANNYARLKLKQESLLQLLSSVRFDQALIFTNYITRAESLCSLLNINGWRVACLTGKLAQEDRNQAVGRLKKHKANIVVATDLASRGLDASSINLVINLDIPLSGATYLHRMGRAGRFGSQGVCITIASEGPDCKRFCNILGDIGGNSMHVNIISKYLVPDLWTVNLEILPKLHGTVSAHENDEETDPENQLSNSQTKFDSAVVETNSSNTSSEICSVNASSEPDTNLEISNQMRHFPMKRTNKIGLRDRKFSNSMREQIEGSESSDDELLINNDPIESKQTLTFVCNEDEISFNSNSESSHHSYKSSIEDEPNEEAIVQSSDIASTDELSIQDEIEGIGIKTQSNHCKNNNLSQNRNNLYPSFNDYYCSDSSQCCQYYRYPNIQDSDWFIRIETQIQNFVNYSNNIKSHNYNS